MEEFLARLEMLPNEEEIQFNNKNWTDVAFALNEVIRLHAEFMMKDKLSDESKNILATTYIILGDQQNDLDHLEAAQIFYQAAIKVQESLRQSLKQQWPSEYQNILATVYGKLGDLQSDLEQLDAALVSYQAAIKLQELLRENLKKQWLPQYQHDLAESYCRMGSVICDTRQLDAAMMYNYQAIQLQELLRQSLKDQWPPKYQYSLAQSYSSLGQAHIASGQLAEAIVSYDQSIQLQEILRQDLKEQWPPKYQISLAGSYINKAKVQSDLGQLDVAILSYNYGIKLYESLRQSQINAKCQHDLAIAYMNLGTVQSDKWQAVVFYQHALKLIETLQQDNEVQDLPSYEQIAAKICMNLGVALCLEGQFEDAAAANQFAILRMESLHQNIKNKWQPNYTKDLAIAYSNLGFIQSVLDEGGTAIESYHKATQLMDALRIQTEKHWLLNHQQEYFRILNGYMKQAFYLPPEISLHTILIIIAEHFELYPSHSQQASILLITLLRCHLVNNEYDAGIQVLCTLQGRELFHRLQKFQHELNDSPELAAYFYAREAFKKSVEQYASIQHEAEKSAKGSEIERLRQTLHQTRTALVDIPKFKSTMIPFHFSIEDLQRDLNPESARLIWLDLPDLDSSRSIQGVLAIPPSGTDVVWIDLSTLDIKPALTLLTRLLAVQDRNARFYISSSVLDNGDLISYCRTHQSVLGLSDEEIQGLTSLNEDNHEYGVDLSNDWVNKLLAKTWLQIKVLQTKIWQSSALTDWLTRYEIRKIYHLSHGLSHNKPLTLGSAPHLEHNVLPNLSLLRLRQHMADSSFTEHQYDGFAQILSCPGEWEADQHIPFTALEAEVVAISLPEQTNTRVVSPTREITPHENQFPKHNNPLIFLHISCHGEQQTDGLTKLLLSTAESSVEIKIHDLWQIAPENSIGFSMINACIGGIVLDNQEGDPQGLAVPLLARSRNVISSLLPVNDIIATVFSALFYHFIQSNQTIEQAFFKTKQHITDGSIPESVLEKLMHAMQPIFQQEHLGRLILRLQHGVLEPTNDTYLLHCLAAIVPNIQEAEKISANNGITIAEYLENEFRSRMKLTHIPLMMREIAMAGYQLYG